AEGGQEFLEGPDDGLLVVDDQDGAHARCPSYTGEPSGRSIQKVEPRSEVSKPAAPPWSSTMRFVSARPRPTPSGRPVTKGSKIRSRRSGGTPPPVSATLRRTDPPRRAS